MNNVNKIFLALIIFLCLTVGLTSAAIVEVSQTSGGDAARFGQRGLNDNLGLGQSFFVDKTGLISNIQIYLSVDTGNLATDHIICELRNSEGTILQSSSIEDIPTVPKYPSYSWKSFIFNQEVTSGTYIFTCYLDNPYSGELHDYYIKANHDGNSYLQGTSYNSAGANLKDWNVWGSMGWDLYFKVTITTDDPPSIPSQPSGQSSGSWGTSYTYSTSSTDLNNDQIKYIFDWGDGIQSVTNFANSGSSASASHSWTNPGTYNIKAMATDIGGSSSGWSTSLTIYIEHRPQLSVSPDPLTFNLSTMKAGKLSSQIFSISNSGGGTLNWRVSDDQPWITINPTSGANSGTVTINIYTADLSPGSYSGNFTVTSDGETKKGSVSFNIEVSPTPTTPVPTTPTGSISVSSTPSRASIYLDTVYKGETPNTITGVSTGNHNIELKFEGFKPWVDSINVEAGSTSKVSASLVPAIPTVTTPPPITPPLTLTTLTPTPTIIIPTLTSTPPITSPSRDLVSIMAVLLIIMGSVLTSLTTIKKDISLEVGVSERSLKYVGGAGILLIAIGAYLLLKAYDLT